jgi:hypothetical protein
MAETSNITREMMGTGAEYRFCAQALSLPGACPWKQITPCVEQLADLLRRVREDVRSGDIEGVFGHETLRHFCKPDFDLIHQSKPACPLTAQVSICKHQVRRACEEKSNPVRLLCCGGRQSVLQGRVVRQIICHLVLNRISLAFRRVADVVEHATCQTAYFRGK